MLLSYCCDLNLTRRGLEACFESGALEGVFYPNMDAELIPRGAALGNNGRRGSGSDSRDGRSHPGVRVFRGRGGRHTMLRASVLDRASPPLRGSSDARGSRSPSPLSGLSDGALSDGGGDRRSQSPRERSPSYIRRHGNPWKRLSNIRKSRTCYTTLA